MAAGSSAPELATAVIGVFIAKVSFSCFFMAALCNIEAIIFLPCGFFLLSMYLSFFFFLA